MNNTVLLAEEIPYLLESAPGPDVWINGAEHLYFAGTSYYCLHGHSKLIQAAIDGLNTYGMNSATARESYGTTALLLEAEQAAAQYFGTQGAAIFASGYLSNSVGLQALSALNKFDVIFMDQRAHFSNKDAALVTNKPIVMFNHMDLADLKHKLVQHLKPNQKPIIVTDGVFALFGNIAPIPEYLTLIEPYDGVIWVDDAHGVGVLGLNGRGVKDHFNLTSERVYFGGTLAKAFGGFGGIIPGDRAFIRAVRQVSILKGASTPPIPALAASVAAFQLLSSHPEMRHKLHENARYFRSGIARLGFDIQVSDVPIAAWSLQNSNDNQKVLNALLMKNIAIQLTHYGDVENKVLRAVVFSAHSREQIDVLLAELAAVV